MSGSTGEGNSVMNDSDPRENPLVQRAFRTGFRSGPGSFRLGWWLTALAAIVVIPFAIKSANSQVSLELVAKWIFGGLLLLLALIFVLGGFQRMLTSFSKERERGTLDFLHLSTLRSTGIVLGFLMAGQLPGYLAMVLLIPVLVILAVVSEFPLGVLFTLLFCLVFYVLVLSILFLYLGFWAKKASEFRGAAIVYIILALIFGGMLNTWLISTGVMPPEWGDILFGVPLIIELYTFGVSQGPAPPSVFWFGVEMSSIVAAVLALAVPAGILFFSLSASLRHRERPAWSLTRCALCYGWITILVIGAWTDQGTPIGHRWLGFAVISWVLILKLTVKGCPTRTQTVQSLGRLEGDWSKLLWSTHGPPFLRVAALTAMFIAGCAWIGLSTNGVGGEPRLLTGVSVGLVLALPIFTTILMQQWLLWSRPALRMFVMVAHLLVIWLPLGVYTFGSNVPWLPQDLVTTYGGVSPFSQILSVSRAGNGAPAVPIFAYQGAYLLLFLLAAHGCRQAARSAEKACHVMLRGEGEGAGDGESVEGAVAAS